MSTLFLFWIIWLISYSLNSESDRRGLWIEEYLKPYRLKDREKLVVNLLDPMFEDLLNLERLRNGKLDPKEVFDWGFETVMIYSLFKQHLEEATASGYREPLRVWYHNTFQKTFDNKKDTELILRWKRLFEEILEISE